MRVVSLIASSTEMVAALGCQDLLVGRSHECDYPPSVRALPALTEPKFAVEGTSAQIDERVRHILQNALSVYRVDPERLEALQPDLILTQAHCQVCAVSLQDVERALSEFVSSRPRVVALEPNSLEDVFRDLANVAEALGVPERGAALIASLKARMAAIGEAASKTSSRPTVACIEWIDPLMTAGNWMPTLVDLAGGRSLFGEAGKHSPYLSWEELVARDPERLFILPCGFDIARTRAELPVLTARPDWRELSAVKKGQAYLLDGNQYFNRPGPRLVESLEILAELIHPQVFQFGHSDAWESIH